MINKDYILRVAEKTGRALALILHLREFNQYEEALLALDDLFLKTVGLPSSLLNSLSEETLVQTFSPLGRLNRETCLWTATLLTTEGEIYETLGNTRESYYRYVKALHLLLVVFHHESTAQNFAASDELAELLRKLEEYEIPPKTNYELFAYYERIGHYAKAEDILFELLASEGNKGQLLTIGDAFYKRLLAKSANDLAAGNLSRDEAEEGLAQLHQMHEQLG